MRYKSFVFAVAAASLFAAAATADDLPNFKEVTAVVENTLHADRKYQPGDLLTRKDGAAVVNALAAIGWKLDDRKAFEKRFLDDGSFLVEKLGTAEGKKFLRQVAKMPLAVDRLDRLSQLPQGRSTVERLIKGPDGYKLLDYMTNAKGGKDLATMLSKDGKGDFNKPTGKIYMEDQLLPELEKLHIAAQDALRKTAKR
jgi:hypothetical protein